MALQDNVKPNHCCLCGDRNRRDLCTRCFKTWVTPEGLPGWLKALQREARKQTERQRANVRRLQRGSPNRRTGGAPQQPGIVFVSLERLRAQEDALPCMV